MTKYLFGWTIIGEAEIEADSPEEAEAEFEQLSIVDLAAEGELEAYPAETAEEREALRRAWAVAARGSKALERRRAVAATSGVRSAPKTEADNDTV